MHLPTWEWLFRFSCSFERVLHTFLTRESDDDLMDCRNLTLCGFSFRIDALFVKTKKNPAGALDSTEFCGPYSSAPNPRTRHHAGSSETRIRM